MTPRKPAPVTDVERWLSDIGEVIRDARNVRGLTERGLAKLANVSRTQLHRMETGQNSSLLLIAKVLRVLGLPATVAGVALEESTVAAEGNDAEAAIAEAFRNLKRVQRLISNRKK